jgi:hypothetical protein
MKQIETPNGYTATERIGGIDIYEGDDFVCELNGVSLDNFTNESEIDDAIEDELDTFDPYNFV